MAASHRIPLLGMRTAHLVLRTSQHGMSFSFGPTRRLYQLFVNDVDIFDILRIFSLKYCMCGNSFGFSIGLHRHLRAVHFNQTLLRQQKKPQPVSLCFRVFGNGRLGLKRRPHAEVGQPARQVAGGKEQAEWQQVH